MGLTRVVIYTVTPLQTSTEYFLIQIVTYVFGMILPEQAHVLANVYV